MAQELTYPDCPAIQASNPNLEVVPVVTRNNSNIDEPIKMALHENSQGGVDIYWVERKGRVARFSNGTTTTLADISVLHAQNAHNGNVEEGLVGIALDPDFSSNGFIYLMFSPLSTNVFRIARYTVNGNSLDSEKILIDIPTQREECCHTGGAMEFDAYGDLWVAIGNNTSKLHGFINENQKYMSDEWGASSTAGLRGGIIRIHPDDSERGYSIPRGNFGAYFADYFESRGNPALAAQYRDENLVFPEIYVKGTRNAYSLALDPVRRWAAWGDVGPDPDGSWSSKTIEEFNLVTHPVFAGWPYWAGDNVLNYEIPADLRETDPERPINDSKWNLGVQQLPPATPGFYNYQQSCAITGPIFSYDGRISSDGQLPPHFHGRWFMTDCSANWLQLAEINENGSALVGSPLKLSVSGLRAPLDMKVGPDGVLYVINYAGWFNATTSTNISRIEYTGPACSDPNLFPPTPVSARHGDESHRFFMDMSTLTSPEIVEIRLNLVRRSRVEVANLDGKILYRSGGAGDHVIRLYRNRLPIGVYSLIITNESGSVGKRILLR